MNINGKLSKKKFQLTKLESIFSQHNDNEVSWKQFLFGLLIAIKQVFICNVTKAIGEWCVTLIESKEEQKSNGLLGGFYSGIELGYFSYCFGGAVVTSCLRESLSRNSKRKEEIKTILQNLIAKYKEIEELDSTKVK